MNLDELFEFYRETFISIYLDLITLLNARPLQIVNDVEYAFAHVAQVFNPELSEKEKEENIVKAYNHLIRATLDCYKLMCVQLKELIDRYKNKNKQGFKPFYKEYFEFIYEFRKARETELKNVGIPPLKSLENYKRAVKIGKNIFENIIKLEEINPKVFIAYKFDSKNKKIAEVVKKLLELEGFVCIDRRTTKAGDVSGQVKKEIENSDGVVVIFTGDEQLSNGKWVVSDWLKDEMTLAIHKNKPIILFFEDCIDFNECKAIHKKLEYLIFNRNKMEEFLLEAIPYIRNFYKKILNIKI